MVRDEGMQPMQHQMMGYDRAITMFSPDGRLLQVEYAKKTVRQGSSAIGIVCIDGVIIVADKRLVDKLIVAASVEKIFEIDSHIAASTAGILSDGRVLVERAQLKAQQHRVTFDSPIDIVSIVKDIGSLCQITTQSAGLRPFGVSLIIGGVNNDGRPHLFQSDPTGIYFEFKATVIGEAEPEIEEILAKEYNEKMTMEEGLQLALRALSKALDKEFSIERIDAAIIPIKTKKIEHLDSSKVEKLMRDAKKK